MGKDSLYCIFVFVQNIYCVIPGRLDNITGSLGRKWPRKGISFEGASPASSTSCEESDFADSEAPLAVSWSADVSSGDTNNLFHGLLTTSLYVCSFVVNLSREDSLLYLCVRAGCSFCNSCPSMIKIRRQIEVLAMNKCDSVDESMCICFRQKSFCL